jgi:hypothetical protein
VESVAGSLPGDDAVFHAWDRGNIRDLGRRRFVRVDHDEEGREIHIFEIIDDEFPDTCHPVDERGNPI